MLGLYQLAQLKTVPVRQVDVCLLYTSYPIESLPQQALDVILYGTGTEKLTIYYERANGRGTLARPFEGVVNNVARRLTETQSDAMRKELEECMSERPCPKCLSLIHICI